jgi:regulator of sirC expression with transglutaminase-like and TPR domain
LHEFSELIQTQEYQLERAALLLAKEVAYADLDIDANLHQLDELSQSIVLRLRPEDSTRDMLRRISSFLFEEEGFHGNTNDYYDPRNSFLNDVLWRYTGIPITLSILYIAVARRVGLAAYGVGLPGHFIVGCADDDDTHIYLDPFHDGLILTEDECRQIALEHLPEGMTFTKTFLAPQSNRMILTRVLNNLRQIYLATSEIPTLLNVLTLQHSLAPKEPNLYRDIGVLHTHLENWGKAAYFLRRYVYKRPKADDIDTIREVLNTAIEKLSQLN